MYSCILRSRGPTPCRTWMGCSLGGSFASSMDLNPLLPSPGAASRILRRWNFLSGSRLSNVIHFTSILSTGRAKLPAPSQDHPYDGREANR
ncbi:hypothetical protein GDO81_025652 [Engystomops pustulosus]|uniref:Uncharacterized protein n=1 Tax=Engystomops pustulosus TaxID=76066 RepID=A0AAV6YSR7_ENGPU|nr:hypothetical protein GDO81_025652 [Engystomops pustulosus]